MGFGRTRGSVFGVGERPPMLAAAAFVRGERAPDADSGPAYSRRSATGSGARRVRGLSGMRISLALILGVADGALAAGLFTSLGDRLGRQARKRPFRNEDLTGSDLEDAERPSRGGSVGRHGQVFARICESAL